MSALSPVVREQTTFSTARAPIRILFFLVRSAFFFLFFIHQNMCLRVRVLTRIAEIMLKSPNARTEHRYNMNDAAKKIRELFCFFHLYLSLHW